MDWAEVYKQIVRFLPRIAIVNPDELGVRIRFGKYNKELTSGVYFCLPYFDEVFIITSVSQVVNISHQSVKSKDNKTVAITCAVTFCVIDVEQAIMNIDDLDDQLRCYIADLISKYVNETDFVNISIGGLSDYVFSEAECDVADSFGIELESVNIYDFAQHKILRLLSGTQLPIEE
jgi:hypothetical protein